MTKKADTALSKLAGNLATIPEIPGSMPQLGPAEDDLITQLAPLAEMLAGAEPPADLLAGIEAELDALPQQTTQIQRADEGEWIQRTEKIWKKILTRDPETGRTMYLLRCLPGAVIPAHLHDHSEHVFIIEGDLWMDGKLFTAGDAQFSRPGTEHPEITIPNGCLVLICA
ncbi:MAG: cupin domain-containing protein [Pseudomonadota bacterium]